MIAALVLAWAVQASGTNASFRGISAVDENVVWASGTAGTYIRTVDGGAHWTAAQVPGAEKLDFRALHAFDRDNAVLLSIGPGENSRLYKTADAGKNWSLIFTNPDPKGFFDALQFWDKTHGILIGDPVDGHFTIMTTDDAGATWKRRQTPSAMPQEGAFAASGTCLIVRGTSDAWFVTGGPQGARVFHSTDRGVTWSVTATPVLNTLASTGIFAIAFSDAQHGIVVGGDYAKPKETAGNIAITVDGGKTWSTPAAGPAGFRSAVMYAADRKLWIVTGTSGSDYSIDGGKTWVEFDKGNYNALGVVSSKSAWAAGPKGAIAKLNPTQK